MKRILLLLALINAYVSAYAQTPDAAGIIYVKKGSAGSGTSWADAYPELAGALTAAATAPAGTVKQIWVAAGSYYPLYTLDGSANERLRSFSLVKDVAIYGGFAGTETAVAERNVSANPSILSGDYNENLLINDNAYHVVVAAGEMGSARLDGFTITAGYQDETAVGTSVTVNGQSINNATGAGICIINTTSLILSDLYINNNYGYNGAGVYSLSNCTLQHTVLSNNIAREDGGGLYIQIGNPIIKNVILSGNATARNGGGVYIENGNPRIYNTQITGNVSSENDGGGIYINDIAPNNFFSNITVSANQAASNGGGIYANRSFTLFNSIVYGNSSPATKGLAPNGQYWGAANLVEGIDADSSNLSGNINPQFVNMPAPGKTTAGDFSLRTTSPVVNKGYTYYFAELPTAATKDLAGNARVFDFANGGVIDMGAYELQARGILSGANGVIYVKKGSTGAGTSWSDAVGELSDAIYGAPYNTWEIWVAAGTYYPKYAIDGVSTNDRMKAFVMQEGIKIYGGFAGTEAALAERNFAANETILSGDLGVTGVENDNAYHVLVIANSYNVAVDGFTIRDGNSIGVSPYDSSIVNKYRINSSEGAGIHIVKSAAVKLSNLVVTNNKAAANGAGIFSSYAGLELINSNLSSNQAEVGAGMYVNDSSTATLTAVTVAGNSAVIGGGLYGGARGIYRLYNVLVNGNVASSYGGGMYVAHKEVTITNATIAANVGGGLVNDDELFVNNSIIYGNDAGGYATALHARYSLMQDMPADSASHNLAGDTDPRFINLPASGLGTTGDFTLSLNSPVINKGSNDLYTNLTADAKDLAGNIRVYRDTIDMGAYELQRNKVIPDTNGIIYVKKGAAGDGSSWTNALGDLGTAMRDAALLNADSAAYIKQIWVTADKYFPLDGITGTGQNASFVPVKDVAVYGGFLGTETTLEERDLNNNLTVLSGDLGVASNTADNAYHVLIASGDFGTATMDGFIVTVGNASNVSTSIVNGNTIDNTRGGGLYVVNSNITFSHMYVNINLAQSGGGVYVTGTSVLTMDAGGVSSNKGLNGHGAGVYIDGTGAEARFTNTIFYTNSGGAVLTKNGGLVTMTNCYVRGNSSTNSEPGVSGYAKLTNVQLTGNSHTGGNGPVLDLLANSTVINCTVCGNNTGNVTGAAVWPKGMIMMSNTVVYGNANKAVIDMTNITGANNVLDGNVNPEFNNAPSYTTAPFTGGDYSLRTSSPLIDAGDNSLYPGLDGNSRDLAGNARVTYLGSGGIIDIGAFEFPVQTIRGNDITKTYGDPDFDPGFTASSGLPVTFTSADTTIASVVNDLIHIKKAGVVNIIATQVGDVGNSPAPSRTFILTINKAVLTVTALDSSKVYNDTAFAGGNGVEITGFVLNDPDEVVTGTLTYGGIAQGAVNVGDYAIEPAGLSAENYTFNYVPGQLTITTAPLIVRANNDSVFYSGNAYTGGNDVTCIGLVNEQTSSVLMGTLIYTGTSQGAVQSGSYVITPGGLTSANYTITFEDGELVIMKDTLRVTANNDTLAYNGTAYTGGNGVIYAGFVNNENETILTGTVAYNGNAQGAVNAGTYTITPLGLTADNYVVEFVDGELVINQLPLTVTAENNQRCYGDADPVLTFTSTGFLLGETFTTAPTGSSNTTATSAAGDYQIVLTGGVADNYLITYLPGTLTVMPAPALTLTSTGEYLCGTTAPVLTATGGAGYTWLRDEVVVNSGAAASIDATAAGVYMVTSTDANGCTGKSEPVTITAVAQPVLTFEANSACIGTPVTISSNSTATGVDYTWTVGDQTSTEASPSFTFPAAGEYVVTGSATSRVCPALAGTVTKTITITAPEPGVTLPTLQAIINERIQLNARELADAGYKWTPATGLSGDEVANPTAVLTESQTYYINMSFASGCVTTDTLTVIASNKPNFIAANAFSPNGDGKNDYLHIKPRDLSYVNYFSVYDRLGNLLFTSKDPSDGWDGTFEGKQMKTDTYIWMAVGVDLSGKIVKRQGVVTLIR